MKHSVLYMKVVMAIMLLSLPLVAIGQGKSGFVINWSAVKVFELDIDSVYNIYIDTLNDNNVDAEFCFQTVTGKLVKTDPQGSILSITDNPYTYFTVFNGDTLILNDLKVENTKGDSIASVLHEGETRSALSESHYIAASSSGIYVYWGVNAGSTRYSLNDQVRNLLEFENNYLVFWTTHLVGLCAYQGVIYGLSLFDGYVSITYANEQSDKPIAYSYADVNVRYPAGIAGYQNSLFVYSNADKALYRLEQSDQTKVFSIDNSSSKEMIPSYGLDGKRVESSSNRIHIRTSTDGSTNKVIIR